MARQSSYFSMVWIHAVTVTSIPAIAWSHCVARDKYILDVDDTLNAVTHTRDCVQRDDYSMDAYDMMNAIPKRSLTR